MSEADVRLDPLFKRDDGGTTVYLLNSPILTGFGRYTYRPLRGDDGEELAELLAFVGRDSARHLKGNVVSAIGHEATARYLSGLIKAPVPVARQTVTMMEGDAAVVLSCGVRLPEGKVLSFEEMAQFAWRIGVLEKEREG